MIIILKPDCEEYFSNPNFENLPIDEQVRTRIELYNLSERDQDKKFYLDYANQLCGKITDPKLKIRLEDIVMEHGKSRIDG